ncbi:MAG TPA: tripartite tricarboxylate transporter substrate binding protein [Beijerinckiaceae bacterium]
MRALQRRLGVLAACVVAFAAASSARAQATYPSQPIRLIVPFGAGGVVDTVARQFANNMSPALGQSFVVENRLGAGGKIAEEFVARAPADGHTLLVNFVTRATLARVLSGSEPEADVLKEFAFAGMLASSAMVFTVPASLKVADFKGLVAKVAAEPGKHSYGTPGPATPAHVLSAAIAVRYGLNVSHVPYRGAGQVQADLASGIISWSIDTPISSRPRAEAGKTQPLFVINTARVKAFPDTPTALEIGLKGFDDQALPVFLMAPAGTPEPVLRRLNEAVGAAHRDPALRKSLEALELIAPEQGLGLEETRAFAKTQVDTWSRTVDLLEKK